MSRFENQPMPKRGKDSIGVEFLSLAKNWVDIKPILSALKNKDIATAKALLLKIVESPKEHNEGETYRGSDKQVKETKSIFDGLANHFSKPNPEQQAQLKKIVDSAILFLEQQPEDINVQRIEDLLDKNGI